MTTAAKKPLSGRRVFVYFFMFFLTVAAVDAYFVTSALRTHTGVVTKNPYEKGLAYNEILEEAKAQEALGIQSEITFSNGELSMTLFDKDNAAIVSAEVTARLSRNMKDIDDINVTLVYMDDGEYTVVVPDLDSGLWTAYLDAKWDSNTYRKSLKFTVQ